jgi:uncharacterized protein VirK/YbjX
MNRDGSSPESFRKSYRTNRRFPLTRLFRMVRDIPSYFKLLGVLISPEIRVIVQRNWRTILIPLGTYLSTNLLREHRINVMAYHYNYLRRNLVKDFLGRICHKAPALWEDNRNGVLYQIVLSVPPSAFRQNTEGDLSLIFLSDSIGIFTLSFTICPGSLFNLSGNQVMYVGRLQGSSSRMDLIRTSTKDCHDTSQQTLLLAVAQGICLSMNISDMVCSSYKTQVSAGRQDGLCNANSIYDEFWLAFGATRLGEEVFYLPVPMPHKPLELIKQHHRKRAVNRRKHRDSVVNQARMTFCKLFLDDRSKIPFGSTRLSYLFVSTNLNQIVEALAGQ